MRSEFGRGTVVGVVLACVLVAVPVGAQFRSGLLSKSTDVVLTRKRPPKVLIKGAAIKIEVVSQTNSRDNVAQRFKSTLETKLLSGDSRLRVEQSDPETLILCTINRLDTKQTAGQRTVTVTKQVGTKEVYNAKKKQNETQAVYGQVNEVRYFTTVQGDLAVSIQMRDSKSGASIDSQAYSPSYTEEFASGTTPPDEGRVEQSLLDRGADEFVRRVTTTLEPVKVMLARTSEIDKLNDLGKAGLWSRMLDQLELVKPFPKPEKEAYRLFNLGVANEALAYGSEDVNTSKRFLERASAYYGQSLEMKPDEKYFRDPQTRISEGLAAYALLERQQATLAAAAAEAAAAAAAPKPTPTPAATQPTAPVAEGSRDLMAPAKPGVFGNKDVIALVAAGLDETNLMAAIKAEKVVSFDLSTAGQLQLLNGKVSNRVISYMRTRLPIKK